MDLYDFGIVSIAEVDLMYEYLYNLLPRITVKKSIPAIGLELKLQQRSLLAIMNITTHNGPSCNT